MGNQVSEAAWREGQDSASVVLELMAEGWGQGRCSSAQGELKAQKPWFLQESDHRLECMPVNI